MSNRTRTRPKITYGIACLWILAVCLTGMGGQAQTPQTVVLDRVVAVVNNSAILASDIDEEIQLSVLDPADVGQGTLTRQRALEQLISRALIQQQIREEDEQAAEPPEAEVDARLMEMRKELPICVRQNCASDPAWKAFLAAHGLTQERVESYLRYRLQILRFIEQRFSRAFASPRSRLRIITAPHFCLNTEPARRSPNWSRWPRVLRRSCSSSR